MRLHAVWWSFLVVTVGCGDNLVGSHEPLILNTRLVTPEDTTFARTLEIVDLDGDELAIRIAQPPAHGAAALAGDRLTYSPAENFNGADAIAISAFDGTHLVTAAIPIEVVPVNDPPAGIGDTFAAAEDSSVTTAIATLLANDTDVDGDQLTIKSVRNAFHGAAAIEGTDIRFTPDIDFSGTATFEYMLSDGTVTVPVSVGVAVAVANDPPVAVDDTVNATEDIARVISGASLVANDSDPDGQTLSVTEVANATNGTATLVAGNITFTPAANFNGTASFDYTVSDGAESDTGHVAIAVSAINDKPIAHDDTATTPEDTAVAVAASALLADDEDVDGPSLTVVSVTAATNGTATLANGVVTFTPDPNFNGTTARFDYIISDGTFTDTGRVRITVTSVNDPPVAADDAASTAEDTPVGIDATSLTANDTDIDSATRTVAAVGNAVNGTVALGAGTVTFTPAANFVGDAAFEYTVTDGAATDTGLVIISVAPVNDPPVAVDDTATTAEDTPVAIAAATFAANDTDVDSANLSIVAVAPESGGTVALDAGTATFTPAANFTGTATFRYTVSDGSATAIGHVAVTVTPVDDPPVAVDDVAAVQTDRTLVIAHAALAANDLEVDGQALSITSVQGAVNGTATLTASTVTFTPDPGFSGDASFEYVVSDGALSDVGRVAVTVSNDAVCGDGVISPPETCDDGNAGSGDGCSAACTVEAGYTCTGEPSACAPICGDQLVIAPEQCDDGNPVNEDGCTNQCVTGVVCTVAALPGGDRFAVAPATGHCYVAFDDDQQTFAEAEAACVGLGGYLATVTSSAEDAVVHAVQNPAQNPWIGAVDDGDDTDAVFDWVTDEAFGFSHFGAGQPDDDGECLHLANPDGEWADTSCTSTAVVAGRICELEPAPCGDSVIQLFEGEECDDGNTTAADGCSAACQLEAGCGDGDVDSGEECDDDNTVGGDGCSATCKREVVAIAIGPGPVAIDQQQRVQLRAIGTLFGGGTVDVTATAAWSSMQPNVATAVAGRVDGVTSGSTIVTALVDGVAGTTVVTVGAATCSIKINEIQTRGDGTSSQADEFAELVNSCTFDIDVTGWNLVYRGATATTDATTITSPLTGVFPAGTFRLYAGVAYNGPGPVDGTFGSTANGFADAGAGVAIRSGPLNTGAIVDSMAWGTATNAFVSGPNAPAGPANQSIGRAPFDGRDSGASSADFVVTDPAATPPTAPTPRTTNFP